MCFLEENSIPSLMYLLTNYILYIMLKFYCKISYAIYSIWNNNVFKLNSFVNLI